MATDPDPKDLESMIEWIMTCSIDEQKAMDIFVRYLKKRPKQNTTYSSPDKIVVYLEEQFDCFGNLRRRRCPNPDEVRLQNKCEFVLETMLLKETEKKDLGLQVLRKICKFNQTTLLNAVTAFLGRVTTVALAKEFCLYLIRDESALFPDWAMEIHSIGTILEMLDTYLKDTSILLAGLERLNTLTGLQWSTFAHAGAGGEHKFNDLVQVLGTHTDSPAVLLPALQLLSNLEKWHCGVSFRTPDFGLLILRVMENHPERTDILLFACQCLKAEDSSGHGAKNRHMFDSTENQEAFVGAILTVLRNNPSNEDLQAGAIVLLGSFLAAITFDGREADDWSTEFGRRDAEAVTNKVVRGGGLELALGALDLYHGNEDVVVGVAGLLGGISWYERGRQEIIRKGVVAALIAAIGRDIVHFIKSNFAIRQRYRANVTALAKLVSRDETGDVLEAICQEEDGVARIVEAVIRFGYKDVEDYLNEAEPDLCSLLVALANSSSPDGRAPLHCSLLSMDRLDTAAKANQVRVANHLVNNFGATASTSDRSGDLPLHTAIKNGTWLMILPVLGANLEGVSTRDGRDCLPLHAAIQAKAPFETLKMLLDFHKPAGKEVCRHDPNFYNFPPAVMAAAMDCDCSSIFYLLRNDPYVHNGRGDGSSSS